MHTRTHIEQVKNESGRERHIHLDENSIGSRSGSSGGGCRSIEVVVVAH